MKKKNSSRIILKEGGDFLTKNGFKQICPSNNRWGYSQVIYDDLLDRKIARLTMDFDYYQSVYYCELDDYDEVEPQNPYRDEFLKLKAQESVSLGNTPIVIDNSFNFRSELCRRFSWSIPSDDFPFAIQKHTNQLLVDIGAGTGYWAWYLKQYGIDTVCYDQKPYKNTHAAYKWFPVEEGGVEKVFDHQDRTLALFWPMYNTPQAYDALKNFKGDTVLYVGEQFHGCTGDDAFHEELDENFEEVYHHYCDYQWDGIHSQETIWKRM